ncbi:MAG: DUF4112 domain-containing protein [Pseudooceanicola atlanticus]
MTLDDHSRFARLERLERLANTMDSAVRIPGTGIRLGLDSIVGIIPGIGDLLTAGPSAYIVSEAHNLGLPRRTLARMGLNIGVDWLIGTVPLIGDIFDIGWKANLRNVALIRQHLERGTLPADTKKAAPETARPSIG